MRFVDLFAGLAGFSLAVPPGDCVFACEPDPDLRQLYRQNFRVPPFLHIRPVEPECVPPHDLLTAGFPCQPFSKAGPRLGAVDPGGLIFHVFPLLQVQRGQVMEAIISRFRSLAYATQAKVCSPMDFGVPQHRPRVFVFVVADADVLRDFC